MPFFTEMYTIPSLSSNLWNSFSVFFISSLGKWIKLVTDHIPSKELSLNFVFLKSCFKNSPLGTLFFASLINPNDKSTPIGLNPSYKKYSTSLPEPEPASNILFPDNNDSNLDN